MDDDKQKKVERLLLGILRDGSVQVFLCECGVIPAEMSSHSQWEMLHLSRVWSHFLRVTSSLKEDPCRCSGRRMIDKCKLNFRYAEV